MSKNHTIVTDKSNILYLIVSEVNTDWGDLLPPKVSYGINVHLCIQHFDLAQKAEHSHHHDGGIMLSEAELMRRKVLNLQVYSDIITVAVKAGKGMFAEFSPHFHF